MTTISNPPASCVEMPRPVARSCTALTLQRQLDRDLAAYLPCQAREQGSQNPVELSHDDTRQLAWLVAVW